MDFKPNVFNAIEKMCTPFLMSEQYNSWLRINPTEILTTNAKVIDQSIVLEMGIKCTMETLIGKKPESKYHSKTIILKPVATIPEQISLNIAAISSYEEASKIITKNFSGQEFSAGKKKVKVQSVTIWHKYSKMVIAMDLIGSINGTIYLTGVPQYNETTQEIYFDQMDYVLDTKNKILKTANWLAQGYILKKIQANCRYSIQSNLEEGKKNIVQYLKNYSPMTGVFINGRIEKLEFKRIALTNQAIIAFLRIDGKASISVDGLK
jgi:hypothetical protein